MNFTTPVFENIPTSFITLSYDLLTAMKKPSATIHSLVRTSVKKGSIFSLYKITYSVHRLSIINIDAIDLYVPFY